MKKFHLTDFTKGWFIGDFAPSILRTSAFEVAYHEWKKGSIVPVHYHKIATEYNLVTYGKMSINGYVFTKGDIFVIEPYEVADANFIEDTGLVIIKVPSALNDKYVSNV